MRKNIGPDNATPPVEPMSKKTKQIKQKFHAQASARQQTPRN
jgi:hypothetical protein